MENIHIPFAAKGFFAHKYFQDKSKNILLVFADEESTFKGYKQVKFLFGKNQESVLYFPSFDTVPYDRVSPNSEILAQRSKILTILAQDQSPKILVTNAQNLITKLPPPESFTNSAIQVKVGDKFAIEQLALFLVNNGFIRAPNAIDAGEFAIRGEIIDIVKSNDEAYRINFGWEKIESIREFDINSQISRRSLDGFELSVASELSLNSVKIATFRKNFLKIFGVNHIKSELYESIISGQKFQAFEQLLPLFYHQMASLFDYFKDVTVIYDNLSLQSIMEFEKSYNDFYQARILSNKVNPDSFYFAIPPEQHIILSDGIKEFLNNKNHLFIDGTSSLSEGKMCNDIQSLSLNTDILFDTNKIFDLFIAHRRKIIIILCSSRSSSQRIKAIIETRDYKALMVERFQDVKKNLINIGLAPLSYGFFNDKYLFISDQDILGAKFTSQTHKSSRRKLKNILTELDNIEEGTFIVHKEHGIGRFEKIETIIVDEIPHDCLKITYSNNDLLYVPVENIEQVTKYGGDQGILDKLGSVNWQKRKARLKNKIKDIASNLIKITAERELYQTRRVNFDSELYLAFCNNFPYSETEDQLSAIKDIEEDLKSTKLMDRLICGDVGFGKTEVAMRAAFMSVFDMEDDSPQVAIISPTTILCRQHYQSFKERFKDNNISIKQLSRLVSSAHAKKIKQELADGKVDIIVGTHALLSKQVKFKNLKLLIIDEEQHFGVVQKEHLKSLKTGVNVLSLSATPIPRTLQMSMSGLKDLSIIATPPIDRLPVRTTIMPFDGVIIRDALMREKFRGGKSFYVAPRIKDIAWIEKKLVEYVPELKFKVAHGQMLPSQLDNIMNEFCDGKFDILLSTTIIESGIDIESANTIIIHKADMLGLSQLYQLRGRVGRGKMRGHAYLTLLNDRQTTKHSLQRLEILQNIDSLGAGFTIATHDMDLRGFGNLVGDEQSGHIREVGSELYQEMLDEAIADIRSKEEDKKSVDFIPSINLNVPVYIPAKYIDNSTLRLAIYRRAGALKTHTEMESFRDEMIDRFGALPEEFENLLNIVKIKNKCFNLRIENLDAGPGGFVMKFNKYFDCSDMVMKFINKFPRNAKIKPDNKLVFIKNLANQECILTEAEKLLNCF